MQERNKEINLFEEIRRIFLTFQADLKEKKDLITASIVIAERKSLLSKKKLSYIAKFRIDQGNREVRFTEMLKESGWGLSSDMDGSPGFGFKVETYKTGIGPREGSIEEQSNLFGKKYSYAFDFKTIRTAIQKKAQEAGFNFRYQITPIGL